MLTRLDSGLGIGTSAAAMASHGLNTTSVEIDPAVTHFARKHFNLPDVVNIVHDDAVLFVSRASNHQRYKYIIHDVFTGGVEPISLFTQEFLLSLRECLGADGSIAIVSNSYQVLLSRPELTST